MAEEKLSIVLTVLDTIGVNDKKKNFLTKDSSVDNVRKLVRLSTKTLSKYVTQGDLSDIDVTGIEDFRRWYKFYVRKHEVPKTREEWQSAFSEDIFENFLISEDQVPEDSTVGITQDSTVIRRGFAGVKISEYPVFDGCQENWRTFKEMFSATAKVAGLGELLKPMQDLTVHEEKFKSSDTYYCEVQYLHSVLV